MSHEHNNKPEGQPSWQRLITSGLAKTQTLRWLVFIVLFLTASYLSLTPSPGSFFESFWDKFLHLLCWGVLSCSLILALLPKQKFAKPLALLFISSACIEAAQHWVPGRVFSLLDVAANGLGVFMVFIICLIAQKFLAHNQSSSDTFN